MVQILEAEMNLDTIQAYYDKATKGEWKPEDDTLGIFQGNIPLIILFRNNNKKQAIANLHFISNAHTDLPLLIQYAKELEAEIMELKGM